MATFVERPTIPDSMHSILGSVRLRIRLYILMQGLGWAGIWLGLTFWIALGIDYLPVAMGLTDLPWQARAFMLTITAGVTGGILYWWILRRIFVPLSDRSMAMLLERQNKEFHDSLVTTIELNESTESRASFDERMLLATTEQADRLLPTANLNRIFNPTPLVVCGTGMLFFGLTLALFAGIAPQRFQLAMQRLYLLDSEPWPRMCLLVEVGANVSRSYDLPGMPVELDRRSFEDGVLKIGEGSTLDLWVKAEAPNEQTPDRRLPKVCVVNYRTDEGVRGAETMQSEGAEVQGLQAFRYSGAPFEGIVHDVRLNVRGGDHRITKQQIEIVDNPVVVKTELDCVFPSYMVDEESGRWTPRTLEYPSGIQLPIGTEVTIRFTTNKEIQTVFVHDPVNASSNSIDVEERSDNSPGFDIELGTVEGSISLELAVLDSDGVLSPSLIKIELPAVKDQAPQPRKELVGIGRAVTRDVQIPITGTVKDDYGVDETWLEVRGTDFDTFAEDVTLLPGNKAELTLDFQAKRRDENSSIELEAGDGHVIALTIKATDHYDLESVPHTGSSETIELDVVSSSELLRILERVEVGQRQRLEQIVREMSEAQFELMRTRLDLERESARDPSDSVDDSDGGDSDENEEQSSNSSQDTSTDEEPISTNELKLLFARRALLQSRKSAGELHGVVESFIDIRLQLINNRVDSEERKKRLKEFVADPLQIVVDEHFPLLFEQIEDLVEKLDELQTNPDDPTLQLEINLQADEALEETQRILADLDQVLGKLIKYESYSELLDLFRDVITEQEALLEETENARKKQGLQELIDQ